jgi:hypothetical protein
MTTRFETREDRMDAVMMGILIFLSVACGAGLLALMVAGIIAAWLSGVYWVSYLLGAVLIGIVGVVLWVRVGKPSK